MPFTSGRLGNRKRKVDERDRWEERAFESPSDASRATSATISSDAYQRAKTSHDNALVVTLGVGGFKVKRCLIDTGAFTNVLYRGCLEAMGLGQERLSPPEGMLHGFAGKGTMPMGIIHLPITFGQGSQKGTIFTSFTVVDAPSAYNALIGRTALSEACVTISIRASTLVYNSDLGRAEKLAADPPSITNNGSKTKDAPAVEARKEQEDVMDVKSAADQTDTEAEEIAIQEGKTVLVGKNLDKEFKASLTALLKENKDVFAYSAADMPGVDPEVITHKLNVDPSARPIKQKVRNTSIEKDENIREEIDKLLKAGFIIPCDYPEWLANVVMVRKASGAWRMCVDFTNLNKACPKDCYPLSRIDQLIDSTAGYSTLSLLDAFSGYHQIYMTEEDRPKCAFITSHGTFMYKMMPFGLKNAGATYQRLVDKVFARQKGRNMKVYVDDAIVKCKHELYGS